ncbi:MAG: hypothetical protein CMM46_11470 [Rhodospirillaceae bacterium]|nr:hypothetical protein [Rhodospirillaceae bacterium]
MNFRTLASVLLAVLCATTLLSACSTFDEPGVDPTNLEIGPDETADLLFPDSVAAPPALGEILANHRARSTAYHLDALRMPAGEWDGYVQASNGSFLQCLIAWGPSDARLGISTGWHGRVFIQFRAPEWPLETLVRQTDLVVTIDGANERAVPLEGSGDMLWGNFGSDFVFAQALADGDELVMSAGNHVMVYPLVDSHLAIPALYECAGLQTEEGGNGGFSIIGLDSTGGDKSGLTEAFVQVLFQSGFGDIVLRPVGATHELYGTRTLFSAPAWSGEAELYARVFGFVRDEKKALIEIANDAGRACRGEVAARLIRLEPIDGIGQFGKASMLCDAETGEFVMETLAYFDGESVLVLHAIVDDVGERERLNDSYDRVIARIAATG